MDESWTFQPGSAFDFRPTSSSIGHNQGFEHGLKGWYTSAAGGSIQPRLPATDAAQATGYARMSFTGTTQRIWRQVPGSASATSHTVTISVRASGAAYGVVNVRPINGDAPGELPSGLPIESYAFGNTNGWQDVTLKIPTAARSRAR